MNNKNGQSHLTSNLLSSVTRFRIRNLNFRLGGSEPPNGELGV